MSLTTSFQQIKNKLFSPSNNAIIHNKFILYFLLFLSLADLLILSVEQDMVSISLFVLIGLLTTYFSKNMLIVLFIALTFTNLIKYGTKLRSEGFTEGVDEEEDEEEEGEGFTEGVDEEEEDEEEEAEEEVKKDKKKKKKKKTKEGIEPAVKPSEDNTLKDAVALLTKMAKVVNTT